MNFSGKRVAIATHVYAPGPPAWDLEKFLKHKVKTLTFFGLPFSYSPVERSLYKQYQRGELKKFIERAPLIRKDFYLFVRDFLLALWWGIRTGRTDVFIGINNLNALVGLILKKFGLVRKVVYYTIDYNPRRFSHSLLNKLYHVIDSYCVRRVQLVWNLSPVMVTEREKKGVEHQYRSKQITVPIGVDTTVQPKPESALHEFEIAYMGHVRKGQGVEFLLEALPEIRTRVPKVQLLVLGGGDLLEGLQTRSRSLGVADAVIFTGFIKSQDELEDRLSFAKIAIAPYEDTRDNFTRYADPGKVKTYLALGLPMVITKVPAVANEVHERKAGIAIDYKRHALIEAVVTLLTNKREWRMHRANALSFAKEFIWDRIFEQAFARLE